MIKAGIDQDAISELFSHAGARQGAALRKAVREAALRALHGRELTLENFRRVLKSLTVATSAGVAVNPGRPSTLESMLRNAVAGMDDALVLAVQANRTALQQFMDLGVGLQHEQMVLALANLEKIEDLFILTVGRAVQEVGRPLRGRWEHVIAGMTPGKTHTGEQATQVVAQLMDQSRNAMRSGRSAGARAAQAMMDSYTSLVSGVLIGMSEGMAQGGTGARGSAENRAKKQ